MEGQNKAVGEEWWSTESRSHFGDYAFTIEPSLLDMRANHAAGTPGQLLFANVWSLPAICAPQAGFTSVTENTSEELRRS